MERVRSATLLIVLSWSMTAMLFGQSLGSEDSHEKMLTLLEQIRERSAAENFYIGVLLKQSERELLESLPPDAPKSERARLEFAVGKDELRLGANASAVEHLLVAHRLSDDDFIEPAFELAVAYLRLAESQNCLAHPNPDRCIFPIRGGGIHDEQLGARQAVRYLHEVLKKRPAHLAARWLLNLAYMILEEYPTEVPQAFLIPPEAFESEAPFPQFRDVAPELGLGVSSLSGGAIAEDFDGDGWLDLVVSDWSPSGQIRYFHNNRDGGFSERTEEAGLIGVFGGLNLVHADYDNDGDPDVLVLRGAWLANSGRYPNSLLQNDGHGRFRDVTLQAGLAENHFPTQTAAWGDYDLDGDLDLYVGNEDFPAQLFRNNGDGTFRDVAYQAGVANRDMAKAVVLGDYDGDRFPDLYVSNFGASNRLYHNEGDGTFTDVAIEADVAYPFKSFGAWFWDFNNDGSLDLFASSYERNVNDIAADYLGLPSLETEPDSLYQGDGRGSFQDVALEMNLTRITQPMGSNFGDLDNDGYLDFYLGTGYPEYEGLMPNLLFHNERGKRFVEVTTASGLGHLQKGHGTAFADFDHDGDQDVFIELGGAYAGDVFSNVLFENPGFDAHWIKVKLIGVESNRSAIGTRIRADITEDGTTRSIYRWVNSGGSFGANPLRQHIGLGQAVVVDLLEVYWPKSDTIQRFRGIEADQSIEITEGTTEYRALSYSPVAAVARQP